MAIDNIPQTKGIYPSTFESLRNVNDYCTDLHVLLIKLCDAKITEIIKCM